MAKLDGQIAIVTGAARGIGKSIAEELAARGAHVLVVDRSADGAEAAASQIVQAGGSAAAYQLDVSQSDQVRSVFEGIVKEWGKLDILVINAGIAGNHAEITGMDDHEWTSLFDVNLNGAFYCLREAAKLMKARQYGRIVAMSSISAGTPLSGYAHYNASKNAIIGLVETAAKELGPYNITVNAIKPGVIRTAMNEEFIAVAEQQFNKITPIGRVGSPKDVAKLVASVVSPDFDFVTGGSFVVDGGVRLTTKMDSLISGDSEL